MGRKQRLPAREPDGPFNKSAAEENATMLQIRESMRLPIGALLLGVALSGAALTGSAMAADRMHTVIIANTGQVNTLDPIRADYAQTYDLVSRIYSVLVTYDAKTNVIGDLASDYKIAPDAKSIDFTLRDATFRPDALLIDPATRNMAEGGMIVIDAGASWRKPTLVAGLASETALDGGTYLRLEVADPLALGRDLDRVRGDGAG